MALDYSTSGGGFVKSKKWRSFKRSQFVQRMPDQSLDAQPSLLEFLALYKAAPKVRLHVQNAIKDERLPLEKVEIGKARLFSIIFFPYVVHIRHYSVPLLVHFYSAGFDLGIMSGINPHSRDFDRLVKRLSFARGVVFIDGDYSGFDYAIPESVGDVVFQFLADHFPPAYRPDVIAIGESLKVNINFLDRFSYVRRSGNCSGQPLTLLFNCVANKFLMYSAIFVWLEERNLPSSDCSTADRIDFIHDHVRDAYFGDDHILAVDPYLPITPQDLQLIFARWSIVYTSTSKTSEVVAKSRIEDVEFLKRKFWKNSFGIYVGVLFPFVIFESLLWRRQQKGATVQEASDAVFLSMFDEVALCGDPAIELFNAYVDFIYSEFFRCSRPPYSFPDRVHKTGLFSETSPQLFFDGFVDFHEPVDIQEGLSMIRFMNARVRSPQGAKALSSLEDKLSLRYSHETSLPTDDCQGQEYPSH